MIRLNGSITVCVCVCRLTAGYDNLLLHYVCLDEARGVILAPCQDHVSQQPLHAQLLVSFKEVASGIRSVLLQRRKEEEEEEDEEEAEVSYHSPPLYPLLSFPLPPPVK